MKLMNYLELLTRPLLPPLKMWVIFGIADPAVNDGHIGITGMPKFDPELIEVMKTVLEDIMNRVPSEHSTPAAKAYFAECILKAAAQGKTNYDALIVAAADQIAVCIIVELEHSSLIVPYVKLYCFLKW